MQKELKAQETKRDEAEVKMVTAKKALDGIIKHFDELGGFIIDSCYEMNTAISHIASIFYLDTKDHSYLDFAIDIVENVWYEYGGNWLQNALNNIDY